MYSKIDKTTMHFVFHIRCSNEVTVFFCQCYMDAHPKHFSAPYLHFSAKKNLLCRYTPSLYGVLHAFHQASIAMVAAFPFGGAFRGSEKKEGWTWMIQVHSLLNLINCSFKGKYTNKQLYLNSLKYFYFILLFFNISINFTRVFTQ